MLTEFRRHDRECSVDSEWATFERESSAATFPDSEQRRNLKSPRRDDDDEAQEGKRFKKVSNWEMKKKHRQEETATSLKRARQHDRQTHADNKSQQISSSSAYQGNSWRTDREAAGRATGWSSGSSSASWGVSSSASWTVEKNVGRGKGVGRLASI